LKKIKAAHGDKVLGEVTVNMAMGGMRGITGMMWETSLLDAEVGVVALLTSFCSRNMVQCDSQYGPRM
jgi:hypothetical protein